jgi:hypothetical protein
MRPGTRQQGNCRSFSRPAILNTQSPEATEPWNCVKYMLCFKALVGNVSLIMVYRDYSVYDEINFIHV